MDVTEHITDRAIAALREGVDQGPAFDMRTRRTYAALDYLERAIPTTWPVAQFRRALEFANGTSRWQNCFASLNGIEVARRSSGNEAGHSASSGSTVPPSAGGP